MINFDEVSAAEKSANLKAGRYIATIEAAEMKKPNPAKDGTPSTKPDYLNLTYALKTLDGKPAGKFWDIITEPNADITKFKLKRLIEACEIKGLTNFELKDLAKILPGKVIGIDLTIDTKGDRGPKTVVDVFSGLIYYALSEMDETADSESAPSENDKLSFEEGINGSDAEDAASTTRSY